MPKRVPAFVLIAGLIVVLAACGGGSSSSGKAVSCAGSKSAASAGDAVSTWCSSFGAILVDGKGYVLYASSADTAKKSDIMWSPVAVRGTPKVAPGLKKSLVGDVTRADGSHQLTYGGHPLYTYKADTGPHLVNGQGLESFGATWYIISAKTGKLITKKLSTKQQRGGNGPGY